MADTDMKPPKFKLPKEYGDDEQAFLNDMRQEYSDGVTADFLNIQAAFEDTNFAAGAQWDQASLNRRVQGRKPVLTINLIMAFVQLVVGNRRLNETQIKIAPDNGGTKAEARVREGAIRNIQKVSRADVAYDDALQQATIGGIGQFKIEADYAGYDVFEQDLKVTPIYDFSAVVWDPLSYDSTGRDARYVFEQQRMPRKEFQRAWPWAQASELGADLVYANTLVATEWYTQDTVRVVAYWKMRSEKATVALMKDGTIVDVTDKAPEEYLANVVIHPSTGMPYIRETDKPYAEMYLCTACDVLAGPYRLPTYRVPIFRVPGWVVNIAGTQQRFGLVRWLKDPQRMFNYWRSVIAERLTMAPKTRYLATKKAVKGLEQKWRDAHLTDDPLLLWDDSETAQKPEIMPPTQMEPALIQETQTLAQDMKNVTGLHEASFGMTSNEVSGKAINARQRIGEMGTVIYHDNLNMAIEEAGRVLNDLFHHYYDTVRMIKILGEDGREELVKINDSKNDPNSIDITANKYSVTTVTGPSYATKRVEAVETLTAFVNSAPEAMAVGLDIIVENLDLPGADTLAKRLRANLPAAMQDPEDMTDEEKAAALQAAEQQKVVLDMQAQRAAAETAEIQARAEHAAAQARAADAQAALYEAQTQKVMAETGRTEAEELETAAKTEKTLAEAEAIPAQTAIAAEAAKNKAKPATEKAK